MIRLSQPSIGKEEKAAVLRVLDSGFLAQGPRVEALEQSFSTMVGVEHAIATSSGTSALHALLVALGIGHGDEVVTSSFTFIASTNSIVYTGAKPVFVDIDPPSFNLNPKLLEAAITKRTKAILLIHLFGLPCEMGAVIPIAEKYGLHLIEDASQSHGAKYDGMSVGSFGHGVFSLYATKNITSGEGGVITTNSFSVAEKCRELIRHGMRQPQIYEELGHNYRMSDIHASIGFEQLKKLRCFNVARQKNAHELNTRLLGVNVPTASIECDHVFHQYTIRVRPKLRDKLRIHLNNSGIESGVFYPTPVHQQPLYQKLGYVDNLPETQRACREVLSLPIHPGLDQSDLNRIVDTVNSFTQRGAYID